LLAFTKESQKHDLAIRKFEGIVMRHDFIFVDLPKYCCRVLDYFVAPTQQPRWQGPNFVGKRQLRPG
jgi:hypothetical protein